MTTRATPDRRETPRHLVSMVYANEDREAHLDRQDDDSWWVRLREGGATRWRILIEQPQGQLKARMLARQWVEYRRLRPPGAGRRGGRHE